MYAARQWMHGPTRYDWALPRYNPAILSTDPKPGCYGKAYEDDPNRTDAADSNNSEVQLQYLHQIRADKTGKIERRRWRLPSPAISTNCVIEVK